MNIDRNYNSQFIQIDFALLDDPAFLQFVNRAEFATYLILRRYIWRGGDHRLGLHELYASQQKLASAVSTPRIATLLGLKDATRVSKHLTYLNSIGVIERIRTGRENVFILGEWHRPPGWDVSKEFYYLENRFGVSQADLAQKAKSDLQRTVEDKSDLAQKAKSDLAQKAPEIWLKKPIINKEPQNREENTVSNGIKLLPDQRLEVGERDYIAQEILDQLKDTHSQQFYRLTAAKVPAAVIRKALAEIKADGAEHPARLFTYRMNQYALLKLRESIGSGSFLRQRPLANGAQESG